MQSKLLAFLTFLTFTLFFAPLSVFANTSSPELLFQKTKNWKLPYKPIDFVQSADGSRIFFLTENHLVLIFETDGTLKGSIPVDKGISQIDTDIRGENILLIDGEQSTFTSISFDFIMDIDITGSPFEGSADAPVTVVVFTNFQCPYCAQLEPLLDKVLEQNKDNIKIVFKHMALRGRDVSDLAALGSFAAEKQGKFWEYHDAAFAAFTAQELSEASIEQIATDLELDMTRFKTDMNSPETRQRLSKDSKDAKKAGVNGTPTVFINGQRLKNRSPNGFQALIDKELAKSN